MFSVKPFLTGLLAFLVAAACAPPLPSTAVPSNHQTKTATPASTPIETPAAIATTPAATFPAPTPTVAPTIPPAPSVMPGGRLPSEACAANMGKIVFSYDPRDTEAVHYGIYIMDPDGSNRVRLSSPDAQRDTHPAWSPDRCWIAFSRSVMGNDDIYVMSADGKTIRRLTTDPADDIFPDWSPDGTQISFVSYRDGGYRNLFVMNADGSNQRQLTDQQMLPKTKGGYVQWQQWSPRGDEIVFTYNPGTGGPDTGPRIYAIRPDGTGLRQVHSRGYDPAWSPDGNKIFFLAGVPGRPGIEIWAVNPDGTNVVQLTRFGGTVVHPDHSLRVSPDGTQLAFYGVGPEVTEFGTEIYVVNVDGSGLKNISHAKGQDEWLDW